MLTSSTLQHAFNISVAIRAAHNLLAANWVGVCATACVRSDRTVCRLNYLAEIFNVYQE